MDTGTRERLDALLSAVRAKPTEFPMAEVIGLAREPVSVSIDRRGDEVVAVVSPRPGARFEVLSKREYEVATLVAAGFSNGQIADALFISLATVKDHVHAILAKTGCRTRSAVAASWYGHQDRSGR
ncbi:MAG: LuxR C-terminal-related transcriptional regulator [Acidimicrobiales bacterium]